MTSAATATTAIPTPFNMRATRVPEIPEALRFAAEQLRNRSENTALKNFRETAWKTFATLGIPETKHEDFTYVSSADLKSALNRDPAASTTELGGDGGYEPIGISPEDIQVAKTEQDAPAALAFAFAGVRAARVTKGGKSSIRIGLKSSSRADHAVFIRIEENADVEAKAIVEDVPDGFVNASVVFSLGQGARLRVLHEESQECLQLLKFRFLVGKDASVEFLSISTGSRLARLAIEADLLAPGASLDLRGAAAVAGTNRVHRHLKIRHAAPDCTSKQLFKAVVPGAGLSSVDGTVIVDPGAQRTDARQLLQHLLLSPEGRANAKPRLLIHADDVKCSHGATVGKTDPAQLFYLLSRGLDRATATALLTQAFLGEALDIAPADARTAAHKMLNAALSQPGKS